MRLSFEVDGVVLEYRRNAWFGNTTLSAGGAALVLQDPLSPGTHFSLGLTRTWRVEFRAHEIVIEKRRPRWFAGFRPQDYRVLVDGAVVAEARGY